MIRSLFLTTGYEEAVSLSYLASKKHRPQDEAVSSLAVSSSLSSCFSAGAHCHGLVP